MGTRGRAKRGRSAECLKSADYCRASFYSLFCVVRNFFSLSCTIFSYPHPADDDDGERRKSKKSDLRSLCVDIISNGNYVIHLNPSFVLLAEFALLVRFQIQQEKRENSKSWASWRRQSQNVENWRDENFLCHSWDPMRCTSFTNLCCWCAMWR